MKMSPPFFSPPTSSEEIKDRRLELKLTYVLHESHVTWTEHLQLILIHNWILKTLDSNSEYVQTFIKYLYS